MGNDYGCICAKETGEVPVVEGDYEFDKVSIIENEKMKKKFTLSSDFKNNPSNIQKIVLIQSTFKSRLTRHNYKGILKLYEYQFDKNLEIEKALKIVNKINNDELNDYTLYNIKKIEQKLPVITPSQNDNIKYPLTFKRNAYQFKNKSVYKGSWNYYGQKHGFGIYIDEEGNKYTGYWTKDVIDGKGRYISKEGNYYEGDWKMGKANGEGTLTLYDGYTYKGHWVNDKQEGELS